MIYVLEEVEVSWGVDENIGLSVEGRSKEFIYPCVQKITATSGPSAWCARKHERNVSEIHHEILQSNYKIKHAVYLCMTFLLGWD